MEKSKISIEKTTQSQAERNLTKSQKFIQAIPTESREIYAEIVTLYLPHQVKLKLKSKLKISSKVDVRKRKRHFLNLKRRRLDQLGLSQNIDLEEEESESDEFEERTSEE